MGIPTYSSCLLPRTARRSISWIPRPYSAPIDTVMPEAKQVGQYQYPFAQGAALHLPRVSEDLQRPQGTVFYPVAHLGETVVIVVTLLAHGCRLQAMWPLWV